MTGRAAPGAAGVAARFTLLASAIAGRQVDVAAAEAGEPTWTDGVTVFVDVSADPADQQRGVAVQAALLAAGSFAPEIRHALGRRPSACRRYLTVEGHRVLAAQEAMLPLTVRALVDPVTAGLSDSPAVSLAHAMSREPIAEAPDWFGVIRPRAFRTDARTEQQEPRGDARQAALNLPEPNNADDAADDASPDGDLSSPVGGGGAIGRLLQRMLRDGRSRDSGPPGADAPTRWTRQPSHRAPHRAPTSVLAPAGDDGDATRRGRFSYPEWDHHRRCYRLDWCTVHEPAPEPGDAVPFDVAGTYELRRPLARVGLDVERRHRQRQGNDIDIDAVVDLRVELLAGTTPQEAVYIDELRRRRDLSVLLLLDVSGSAGEPSETGVAVHEHQRAAAARLTGALHDLGDRVALYAFRSTGRSAVQLVPVKRFDDGCGPMLHRRLGALVPGAYTRLGAAIRHGAAVLEAGGGTGRRLLVVLSDGFAYDHGYEGPYGEADARRALAEARRRGTGCVCLSVGVSTDADELRRVFGTAAHATIPRVEQLPSVIGPLFRAALLSAESQRRSWQRSERLRERVLIEGRTA